MPNELDDVRKEFLQMNAFRKLLHAAEESFPKLPIFNPLNGISVEEQQERWKYFSAQQEGFRLAFEKISGIKLEDLKNDR